MCLNGGHLKQLRIIGRVPCEEVRDVAVPGLLGEAAVDFQILKHGVRIDGADLPSSAGYTLDKALPCELAEHLP
ncbi:MAG: hypothetical protein Q8M16_13835 [Pirellulaceae bacterium]|nr:hypothetical protein [Pirellulaceae bacterium]